MELNASDTRSKNSLKEVVAESLNNTSIKDFCSGMDYFKYFCSVRTQFYEVLSVLGGWQDWAQAAVFRRRRHISQ